MNESIFPLAGVAVVVVAVLPAAALAAKAGLVLLERRGLMRRLDARYTLLVGSSFLPLAWLVSAGLHQSERAGAVVSCLFDHDVADFCFEPAVFAALLSMLIVGCALGLFRRNTFLSARGNKVEHRIIRLAAEHSELAVLKGRIELTESRDFAVATVGLLRHRVIVSSVYAAGLSDRALVAALGHEAQHVKAKDPLRYFLLDLALALNPLGAWLLRPHVSLWLSAREAQCDREAVIRGARPLLLAEALLAAARPIPGVAALGARDSSALRLRIEFLVAFAERSPILYWNRGPSVFSVVACLVALAVFLPHQLGAAALDALHSSTEHAISNFIN